jgi:hypothetical protein
MFCAFTTEIYKNTSVIEFWYRNPVVLVNWCLYVLSEGIQLFEHHTLAILNMFRPFRPPSGRITTTSVYFSVFVVAVLLSTTNKMQRYTIFCIIVNVLHISGGFSADHQGLKNCTHIWYVPGLLLLPLAWLGWKFQHFAPFIFVTQ